MSGLEVWKELATTQLASKPLDKNACLYFQSKSNRVSLIIFSSQAKGTQVLQPLWVVYIMVLQHFHSW